MKILIVDDSGVNRRLLEIYLKNLAILDIQTACDGLEAVQLCEKNAFDIIFMDIEMPIMDGFEATKKIKEAKSSKIIAVTSHYFEDIEAEFLMCGFDDYIPKPISQEVIENYFRNDKNS